MRSVGPPNFLSKAEAYFLRAVRQTEQ